jgi:deoxyribonuclease-1-like protein
MARAVLVLVVVAAVAGGSFFFLNYEIQKGDPSGWKIVPRKAAPAGGAGAPAPMAPQVAARPTLRIASFHLGRFDDAKLANPRASDILLKLLPQFDLVAVQGVRGRNKGVLIRLIEQINATPGRAYDFATCPTQQRDGLEHYSAFLFDTARVNVDRTTVRFVEDPLGKLRIKPLVGHFSARGPDAAEAFTFVLINVEVDPDRAPEELDRLADAYRAVRDGHRSEDDIILLGDLESDDQHLGRLGKLLGVAPLISGVATTSRGTQLLDNILLDRRATCEFIGRVEVVDVMREYRLTQPEVLEISEHLPIWAEFSIYENGQAAHVLPTAN